MKKIKEREKEEEAKQTQDSEEVVISENGDRKTSIPSPMATDSCDLVAPGNTSTSTSSRVIVNGGGDEEHDDDEESDEKLTEDRKEKEEKASQVRRSEVEEELLSKQWGPLKGPVQVKIADLGNSCWVVS